MDRRPGFQVVVQSAQKRQKSNFALLRCCFFAVPLFLCSLRCARAEPFPSARESCCVACLPLGSRSSGALALIGPAARDRNCCSVPIVALSALLVLVLLFLLLVLPSVKPNSAKPAKRTRHASRTHEKCKEVNRTERQKKEEKDKTSSLLSNASQAVQGSKL